MSARTVAFIIAVFACALAVGLVYRGNPLPVASVDAVPTTSVEVDQSGLPFSLSERPSAESSERRIGLTLFPSPVEAGESLRFLVDGSFFERPDTTAHGTSVFREGEVGIAFTDSSHGNERWIEMAAGWIPAPVVDRLPEGITDALPPGEEGLISGRVLPWDYYPADLVAVPPDLVVTESGGRSVRLRSGALEAFREMITSARNDGLDIRILSGFRSGSYQRLLYSRQLGAKGVFQNVSAPPGRSEHQLGTTADVTANETLPLRVGFGETIAGRWIAANSKRFGLVLSFSRERHRSRRISYEPWHLRWVGPNAAGEAAW